MLELQQSYFAKKIARQKDIQRGAALPFLGDVVLCVEHSDAVYTMGKRDTSSGLNEMRDYVQTRRGGGLTWHGPGQLTCYPLANIKQWWAACSQLATKGKSPVKWYSDALSSSIVETMGSYGVASHQRCVGVWVTGTDGTEKKVGSIGLQLSDWVSMHGMGLNVHNDVSYFDRIVMCEMPGKRATTLHLELGARGKALPSMRDVEQEWLRCFLRALCIPNLEVAPVDARGMSDEALQTLVHTVDV